MISASAPRLSSAPPITLSEMRFSVLLTVPRSQPGNSIQQNQKLLVVTGSNVRIRFVQQQAVANKRLSAIVVSGDYRVWSAMQNGAPVSVGVDWRGYRTVNDTDAIFIKYDLVMPDASRVSVEEKPEALAGAGLIRTFAVVNLPPGTVLSLKVNGTGLSEIQTVTSGSGTLRTAGGNQFVDLGADGTTTLTCTWQ